MVDQREYEESQAPDAQASWRDVLAPCYRYKILFLGATLWLHAANSMLAATTLPAAVADIGGLNLINWAFALYLTASIVAGTTMSLFVSQYGLKRTMWCASVVYISGCAICGTAESMPVLLIGRVLQGAGGGGLVALVYLMQNLFFPNRLLPRIIGCLSMVWMISAFCGPLVGGTFATLGLWRGAFAAFAFQAILLLLAIPRFVPDDNETGLITHRKIPIFQLVLLTLAILLVSTAGLSYDKYYSPIMVITAFVAFILFVIFDQRAGDSRMLPKTILTPNHRVRAGLMMTLSLCIALMSFLIYGPILLIKLHGLTPLMIGFILMLEAIAWSTAAILFSGASIKTERKLIVLGNALVLAGIACNAIVVPFAPLWLVIISVSISNFGFGMMWGYIIRRVSASADKTDTKRASSILPVTQQTGFALGAAFAGLIANGLGLSDESTVAELRYIAIWLFAGFIPVILIGNYFAIQFTRTEC